jgi:hypothetical protein
MNLNGDEKRIQQLFRELGCEDENRAPVFASVIAAASSRTDLSQNRTRAFALAWAVAGILIATLIAVSLAMRHPGTQTQDNPRDRVADEKPSTEGAPASSLTRSTLGTLRTSGGRTIRRRVRPRRHSDELAIRMKWLSSWRSPTASLLKAPGEEMSLPRLGESLLSIKIFSPDEFN